MFFRTEILFRSRCHFTKTRFRARAPPRIAFCRMQSRLSIANLLNILRVTKQSLARVLRELIDEGYIKKLASDRRKRLLFLTAKGHKLHDSLIAPQIGRFEQVAAEVDTPLSINGKKSCGW